MQLAGKQKPCEQKPSEQSAVVRHCTHTPPSSPKKVPTVQKGRLGLTPHGAPASGLQTSRHALLAQTKVADPVGAGQSALVPQIPQCPK